MADKADRISVFRAVSFPEHPRRWRAMEEEESSLVNRGHEDSGQLPNNVLNGVCVRSRWHCLHGCCVACDAGHGFSIVKTPYLTLCANMPTAETMPIIKTDEPQRAAWSRWTWRPFGREGWLGVVRSHRKTGGGKTFERGML